MDYILQISTGTLKEKYYNIEDVINKIEYINSKLKISKVIFGWYQDKEFNQKLCNYLKTKNIQSIFKLPIFSEITNLSLEQEFIYYNNININTNNNSNKQNYYKHNYYKNDKFDFVCPNSKRNLDYIINIFNTINKDVNFDGVFFDRIRYPSDANHQNSIYGCTCIECSKVYSKNHINLNNINNFKIVKRKNFIYKYQDKTLNKLMNLKRKIITNDVKYLSNNLKKEVKIIGIDTFSSIISDFVGQDLKKLSKYVDFIKPMDYFKTFAPAGIGYEINGLNNDLKESLNYYYKDNLLDINNTINLNKQLLKYYKEVCIGLDANNIPNICNSDINYLKNYITLLEKNNIKEVVLSWNIMLIDNNIFDNI